MPPRIESLIEATCREILFGEVEGFAAASGEGIETVRERLGTGRRGFGAWVADKLVAYGWVSQTPEYIGEQERTIKLEPGEAYIWDCVTLPEWRGKRLYSALLSYMLGTLARERVRRVWIGAATKNRPSVQGFLKAGFQPVITVTYARLGKLRVMWIGAEQGAPRELVEAARRMWLEKDEKVLGGLVWSWK